MRQAPDPSGDTWAPGTLIFVNDDGQMVVFPAQAPSDRPDPLNELSDLEVQSMAIYLRFLQAKIDHRLHGHQWLMRHWNPRPTPIKEITDGIA